VGCVALVVSNADAFFIKRHLGEMISRQTASRFFLKQMRASSFASCLLFQPERVLQSHGPGQLVCILRSSAPRASCF
jgi:hypothetical protein